MGGFFVGTELQARLMGWLIVGSFRLVVLILWGWWWLMTRHPLVFVAGLVLMIGHAWSRDPQDQLLVMALVFLLGAWGLVHGLAGSVRRVQWRQLPGDYLERPEVRERVVGRIRNRRAQAATQEALRAWARTRRRGGRWRDIPADYLARPDVQHWIAAQVREGHSRDAVAEALRIQMGTHRRSRRWELRELRRLSRDVASSTKTSS